MKVRYLAPPPRETTCFKCNKKHSMPGKVIEMECDCGAHLEWKYDPCDGWYSSGSYVEEITEIDWSRR